MKRFFAFLYTLSLLASAALADSIGGIPEADFSLKELKIPCVEVKNLNPNLDGKHFDVILEQEDDSFRFRLKLAEREDDSLCQSVGNFAEFEDDDFRDDSVDDNGNGNRQGSIFVKCETRSNRSKISVDGKNLPSGQYYAIVTSGANSAQSLLQNTIGDEVEFDFDSEQDDIAAGATAIPADFIDGPVTGQIFDDGDNLVASLESVACLSR